MKKSVNRILVVVGIVLAILLCVSQCNRCTPEKTRKNVAKKERKQSIQNDFFAKIDQPYETIVVDADKAQTITTQSGEELYIPKGAFLNAKGEKVSGKVSLKFRKFDEPIEYMVAQIPMKYQGKIMESGGMFELNASQNNAALFVNPEQKIKMKYDSWTNSKEYSIFNRDAATNEWKLTGKDSVVAPVNKELEIQLLSLSKPLIASKNAFSIVDETARFPELKEYENVLFDPVGSCSLEGGFTSYRLQNNQDGTFTVTGIFNLGKIYQEQSCRCYLAFNEGVEYSSALAKYQKKYDKLLKKRLEYYKSITNKEESLSADELIERVMEIENFGYINCDQIINNLYDYFAADFFYYNDKPIAIEHLYLLNNTRKTYLNYKVNEKIYYFSEGANVLCGIDHHGDFVYLKAKEFKALQRATKKYKVKLHTKKGIHSMEEMKALLYGA
jgi:hypothetical protein